MRDSGIESFLRTLLKYSRQVDLSLVVVNSKETTLRNRSFGHIWHQKPISLHKPTPAKLLSDLHLQIRLIIEKKQHFCRWETDTQKRMISHQQQKKIKLLLLFTCWTPQLAAGFCYYRLFAFNAHIWVQLKFIFLLSFGIFIVCIIVYFKINGMMKVAWKSILKSIWN